MTWLMGYLKRQRIGVWIGDIKWHRYFLVLVSREGLIVGHRSRIGSHHQSVRITGIAFIIRRICCDGDNSVTPDIQVGYLYAVTAIRRISRPLPQQGITLIKRDRASRLSDTCQCGARIVGAVWSGQCRCIRRGGINIVKDVLEACNITIAGLIRETIGRHIHCHTSGILQVQYCHVGGSTTGKITQAGIGSSDITHNKIGSRFRESKANRDGNFTGSRTTLKRIRINTENGNRGWRGIDRLNRNFDGRFGRINCPITNDQANHIILHLSYSRCCKGWGFWGGIR